MLAEQRALHEAAYQRSIRIERNVLATIFVLWLALVIWTLSLM